MSNKPKIEVGQRWVTRGGARVRILAVDGDGPRPVVGQVEIGAAKGNIYCWGASGENGDDLPLADLVTLAPSTVKREVALYRTMTGSLLIVDTSEMDIKDRVSEPVLVEFTLLPGESA